MNYTEAYSCYPLKCALDPATPRNEGTYRMIHVKAPEGSILNPRFPAPVHARQLVGHCLAAAIYEALAPVLGERIIAECGSAPTLRVLVSGYREGRRRYTAILFINGGMGARAERDGLSATCFPSNVVCGSMEIIEALSLCASGARSSPAIPAAPGRRRGGLGQDVEIELTGSRAGRRSRFWSSASITRRAACWAGRRERARGSRGTGAKPASPSRARAGSPRATA